MLFFLACVDPPTLINGSFISNGSVVTYMCEEGFALIGNRQRFCNFKTLMFNGSDPTCEGILLQIVAMVMSNIVFHTKWGL